MDPKRLKELDKLLSEFEDAFPRGDSTTTPATLCGRNMDLAIVTSLRAALPAYGMYWTIKFKFPNDKTEDYIGYYSRSAAVQAATYFMENWKSEFDVQPLSYEIE
jgi:hypothetical protein